MEYHKISNEEYSELMTKLDNIQKTLEQKNSEPDEYWWDNDQLARYLKVSKRTLQTYRDKKLIRFRKQGAKDLV